MKINENSMWKILLGLVLDGKPTSDVNQVDSEYKEKWFSTHSLTWVNDDGQMIRTTLVVNEKKACLMSQSVKDGEILEMPIELTLEELECFV